MTVRDLYRRLAKEIKQKNGHAHVKLTVEDDETGEAKLYPLTWAGSTNDDLAHSVYLQAKPEPVHKPQEEETPIWKFVSRN